MGFPLKPGEYQQLQSSVVVACELLEKAGILTESWRRDGPMDTIGPMPEALVAGVREAIRRLPCEHASIVWRGGAVVCTTCNTIVAVRRD